VDFVILLSLFVIRSVEMLKAYMVRERLGSPAFEGSQATIIASLYTTLQMCCFPLRAVCILCEIS